MECEVEEDRVVVELRAGTPLASVVDAVRGTGKEAAVCGLGSAAGNLGNSIAVLLDLERGVSGTIRFVQLAEDVCLVDGWIEGLQAPCSVRVHTLGDFSEGTDSVGPVLWTVVEGVGGESGKRVSFLLQSSEHQVWNLIGRALVVWDDARNCAVAWNNVARSAGLKQNPKNVCPCGPGSTDMMAAAEKANL